MDLIIFGPPGSGKGTQAARIAETWHIPHISTGEIFRANIRDRTPLGERAQAYVRKGDLVPNEVVIGMTLNRLDEEDCASGFLLDGFPRDVEQAERLEQWLLERGRQVTAVLSIYVDDETIIQRVISRRVCESCGATYNLQANPPESDGFCDRCGGPVVQRPDDRRETIERRLQVYKKQTAPVEAFYRARGVLVGVSGQEGIETVFSRIREAVEESQDRQRGLA